MFSRNADSYRYPASLTKMMTLYLTFEAIKAGTLSFDDDISVSAHAAGQAPSKLGLKAGETITVKEAVLALVTKSANDAAVALAESMASSEAEFAKKMTAKADTLGMSRTTFRNASGLPDTRQRTTARDLATLGRALMNDFPHYFDLFSTASFTWKNRTYPNHDKLLAAYPGTTGLKTGYTAASGFNLATSVDRDGYRLIGVVLGGRTAKSRDDHMMQLLDMQFARLKGSPTLADREPLTAKLPSPRPDTIASSVSGQPLDVRPPAAQVVEGAMLPPPPPVSDVGPSRGKRETKQFASRSSSKKVEAATFTPVGDPIGAAIAALTPDDNATSGDGSEDLSDEQGDTDLDPSDARVIDWLGDNQHWGIQIGAFTAMETAAARLSAAAALAPDQLKSATPAIVSTPNGGSTIYKARFGPFEEKEARNVCSVLTSRGVNCVPVKDDHTP